MDSNANIDSDVCSPTNLPRPRWMVRRLPEWYEWRGNSWESSSDSSSGYAWGNGLTWNGFEAPPGTYRLEMEFPLPLLRQRPMPLITLPPNFGLIYGSLLWILIFIFMIVVPFPSKGLFIQFSTHESTLWEKGPWQEEAVSVYLAVGEKYYVNGQLVPRDNLRARLLQELSHRWSGPCTSKAITTR